MAKFKTFVINLDASTDRLESITSSLKNCNIEFDKIAAVDARDLPVTEFDEYDDVSARGLMGRSLLPGEIGCYLSHCRALEEFLKSEVKYGLILEDDAIFASNFSSDLHEILNWLETNHFSDWQLINLRHPRVRFLSHLKHFSDFSLVSAHYAPMIALSLLWTRKAAETFLQNNRVISAPFDNAVQNWFTRNGGCLAVRPPLAGVADFDSTLDGTPIYSKPVRRNNNRALTYGLLKQKRLWRNRYWAGRNKYGI